MSSQDTFIAPPPRKKKNIKALALTAESLAPPTLDDEEALYDSAIASQLVPSRSLAASNGGGIIGQGQGNEKDDGVSTSTGGLAASKGLSLTKLPTRAAPPNPDGSIGKRASRIPGTGNANGSEAQHSKSSYHNKLSERIAGLDIVDNGSTHSSSSSLNATSPNNNNPTSTTGSSANSTRSKREGRKKKIELKQEDLKVLGDLGAGAGGSVAKVVHSGTGLMMAKKLVLIDAKPTVRKQILRELQILHDCSSPWIVSFYGAFLSDPHICICMEYMDRGSLDGIYKKFGAIKIEIVGKIAEAVLEGLTYLYDVHRIIHRDIKPSNILVNSEGEIKICDFGVSGELINSVANTFVGTSTYMSPERIQGSNYSVKSDVWSLGVSLIELALGRFPFADEPLDSDDDCDLPGSETTNQAGSVPKQEKKRAGPQGVSLDNNNAGGGGMTMSILDLLQHIVNEPAPKLTPVGKYPKEAELFVDSCLVKDPKERRSPKGLLKSDWMNTIRSSQIDLKAWAATIA